MFAIVASVGGALVSGIMGSKASRNAADAQVQAANIASETQWKMYQQTRQDQLPWLTAGSSALTRLESMVNKGPGDFESSPYYQLGLDEQNKATNAFLASRGQYASGKAAKDLQTNAVSNMAQNRGNWLNEWISTQLNPTQSLAQVGQSTATNLGNAAMNTASNVGNLQLDAGNARATGYINQNNAWTGAINNGANALATYFANKNQWGEA